MNAANSAVGSTPADRTTPDVYAEIVRTPSAPRSPRRASASATGASAFRSGEPYSRVGRGGIAVDVCDHAASARAPAGGREARERLPGRPARERRRARRRAAPGRRGTAGARRTRDRRAHAATHDARARTADRSPLPPAWLARTRTSSSADSASNFWSSEGDSGRRVSRPPDHEQLPPHADAAFASSSSIRVKTASSEIPVHRRGRCFGQARAELRVGEEPLDRGGERGRVTRRDEQAVHAVAHDLGHAADRGCDHRAAHGERLHDRVREVLPRGRQQRGVRRAEEAQHLVARDGPQEAHPLLEPELASPPLERRAIGAVAGDRPARPRRPRASASSAVPSDFCGPSRPANASTRPSSASSARSTSRGGSAGTAGAGFGSTETCARVETPTEGDVAEIRARTEDVSRPTERRVACRAQETRPQPADALELVERPGVAATPGRALERLVRDELHDQRARAEARADRGPTHHARRVDHIRVTGPPRRSPPRRARGARASVARSSGRDTYARPAPRLPSSPPRRHALARSRKSASAGAWLAGPPASGGQIPADDHDPHDCSAASPASSARAHLVVESHDHDDPGESEHDGRREHRDGGAGRAPLGSRAPRRAVSPRASRARA